MANIIQLRQGIATAWSSNNPVLAVGEIALDTTNKNFRVGDGSSTWSSLTNWITAGGGTYTLPTATSSVLGGVELFSDTVQSVAANTISSTASRTYGAQLNSSGQLVINVPWTDTTSFVSSVSGTGTVSGISLSGTVTSTGNLTLGGTLAVTASNFASQTANTFLAAPNGSAGIPTFRTIVAADIPTLNQSTTGSAGSATNLTGGSASHVYVPYQSNAGTTSYVVDTTATTGQVLTYQGSSTSPSWTTVTGSLGWIGTTQTTASSAGTTTLAGINTITPNATTTIQPASVATTPGTAISIISGATTNTTGTGGSLSIIAGAATTGTSTATGGGITITAGASNTTAGLGGNISINAGLGSVANGNGSISIGTSNTDGVTIGASNKTITINGNVTLGTPLPLASGGTGKTTGNAALAVLHGYTSTVTSATTVTLTNTSSYYQIFTGTTNQILVLPVTSTLQTGWTFVIINNNSTQQISVQSSGGNSIINVPIGLAAIVTCIGTTLTTAADWEANFFGFPNYTGSGNVVLQTSAALTNTTFAAPTSSQSSIIMTSGTQPTLASQTFGQLSAGAESLGLATPKTTGTGPGFGIVRAPQMVFSLADMPTTANSTTPVAAFAAANDILSSLEVSKLYRFRGIYYVTYAAGGTAAALQLVFGFSNAPQAIKYSFKTIKSTSATTMDQVGIGAVATGVSVSTSTLTGGTFVVEFDGYFTSNATTGGTFTPQVAASTSTSGGTFFVTTGSWIEIEKLGTSTQTLISGNWA
jgi:hypothetical protein